MEPASVEPVHSVASGTQESQITLLLLLGQTTDLEVVPGRLALSGLFVVHAEPLTLDFSVELAGGIVSGAKAGATVAALSMEPASVEPVHSVASGTQESQITLLLLLGQTTDLDVVPGRLALWGLFVVHAEPLTLDFSVELAGRIVSGARTIEALLD